MIYTVAYDESSYSYESFPMIKFINYICEISLSIFLVYINQKKLDK